MTSIFVAMIMFGAIAAVGRLRVARPVILPAPEPLRREVVPTRRLARPPLATPSAQTPAPLAHPARYVLTDSASDRTPAMLAAMHGPGICTPRDC